MSESTRGMGSPGTRSLTWLALPALLCGVYTLPAAGACPAGQSELLPNIRALPPSSIAMRDATNMKFSATSWNSGAGHLVLVPRNPETDPASGQIKQPVDQRVSCSGGGSYDRPAGRAEYHAEHNHVHYNDYANYILEPVSGGAQNPRQGSKTTFCIMDTTAVNPQLQGAAPNAVFAVCPTQDPDFNTQGMSIGWGDTYGSNLAGQSLYIGDLAPGMYRLRHVFDPKNLLIEQQDSDNESCKLVEIGDGSNGRYVTDRGRCVPAPAASISSLTPRAAQQGTCVAVTITGANLTPELRISLSGGTGPLPSLRSAAFDATGNYATGTVCVPKAKGGRNPKLGSDPVWDLSMQDAMSGTSTNTLSNVFTVTP